jgi:hypothetical protein
MNSASAESGPRERDSTETAPDPPAFSAPHALGEASFA